METPISIIIPAFNQLEYCRQCIHSLLLNTSRAHRLILVDNGSTDGVGAFFDSIPGAVSLHAGKNLGFAGGVNLGLEQAEGHVLLLNSDTIVPRGWLERLEKALLQAEDIGIVGPRSNCVSGLQQIDGLELNCLEEIDAFAEQLAQTNAGRLTETTRLVGFCMLIRDRTAAQVGRFDEAFGIGNFEDDDYCLRALRAGYRLRVAEDCFVFHYGGRTFRAMGLVEDQWRELINRNERIFLDKWSGRAEALERSRALNQQARAAFERGDTLESLRLYKEAITAAPFDEVNYNDLGVALWQWGEHQKAVEYFERALQCRPDYPDARENLRQANAALGPAPPQAPG